MTVFAAIIFPGAEVFLENPRTQAAAHMSWREFLADEIGLEIDAEAGLNRAPAPPDEVPHLRLYRMSEAARMRAVDVHSDLHREICENYGRYLGWVAEA